MAVGGIKKKEWLTGVFILCWSGTEVLFSSFREGPVGTSDNWKYILKSRFKTSNAENEGSTVNEIHSLGKLRDTPKMKKK